MGHLYRSEEMTRCQLYLQTEAAYACVAELGELGLIQFRDLNPETSAFQRKFVNEVRRCDEMERKLRFLEKEIKKDEIPMLDTGENPDAPQPREMIDLEATFEKLEAELREVNGNEEMLKKNFLELSELKHILRKTQTFFDEREDVNAMQTLAEAANDPYANGGPPQTDVHTYTNPTLDLEEGDHQQSNGGAGGDSVKLEKSQDRDKPELNFVAGVILRERLPTFERLLWRACRGNVFLKQSEITEALEDPVTGDQVYKCVFVIFFQGEQLKTRVKKICEGFRATLYPCPETPQERREMAIGVMTRIEDLKTVLGQTQDHRHRVLVAAAKNIRLWFTKVRKIKAIYHTLNLFNIDVTQKCLIAECWCPVADLDKIQLALKRGTEESGSTVPSILHRMETSEMPPTYFRVNKFTRGFQTLVDSYGVATYQEVNPAPYTIISFPFLFAIMFGDAGHGMLMFLFALFMVVKERMLSARKDLGEIFSIFFAGRYIILLMGIFSMYTGAIYNDMYSLSINMFGSGWRIPNWEPDVFINNAKLTLDPNYTAIHPYPFGMDPIWQLAENKLLFLNSFKMKMSIIFGVFQMLFGVCLSLMNHRYFRKPLNIVTEFIPQLIFLSSIFVYLAIEIFYKWTHFGTQIYGNYPGSHCAPQLLIGLINMFMMKSRKQWNGTETGRDDPSACMSYAYYSGEQAVETLLVFLAVICVPWMLIIKPVMLNRQHKRAMQYVQHVNVSYSSDDEENGGGEARIGHQENEWDDSPPPTEVPAGTGTGGEGSSSGSGNGGSSHAQEKGKNGSVHADMNDGSTEINHDKGASANNAPAGDGAGHSGGGGHGAEEEFNFGDTFILQAIHTIEFCLGCISHTASYLRLWALSLAHAELSEVLWNMVMKFAFTLGSGYMGSILCYLFFGAFAALTVSVLIVMEGLSAFLHALRLHWVEFNSKFYKGDGYAFTPFSFDLILEEAQEADDAKG